MDRADFETALEEFRATAEAAHLAYFARNDFTFAVPSIKIAERRGTRYVKLWNHETRNETGESRCNSIHSFVEIATGDILKPEGTKKPAKHARGNIYEDAGRASLTDTGSIRYMK